MNLSFHYTVYKLGLDDNLTHKEHINADELDQWMDAAYGLFATVKVVRSDNKFIVYTDNGESFEKINWGYER